MPDPGSQEAPAGAAEERTVVRTASQAARGAPRPPSGAGALVRLPLTQGRWAEDVPPVPGGHVVTVSFSSAEACDTHGEALRLLGFTVVEQVTPVPGGDGTEVALMVVSGSLAGEHAAWFAEVRDRADRVYSLVMGPVGQLFADVLRAHLGGRPGDDRRGDRER